MLQPLGQLSRRKSAQDFELAAADPRSAQEDKLQTLLWRLTNTEFGRLHGFANIRTPAEFAERVPVMTSQDLGTWVDRMMQGERGLITDEAPIFYGVSTGGSGSHKHIPITPAYRREFQMTLETAFWHLYRRFPRAFTSKFLYFVGLRRVSTAPDGLDVGTMSGFNFTEQPKLVQSLYAWPYELFLIDDMDARSYMALHSALLGDVSLITGVFPLPIITMLRDLEQHAETLARDFERGTLDGARGLTPEQRAHFSRGLGPRPDLARRLRRAMQAPVEEKAKEALPKLALTYCWTTSTAGLYVPEMRRRLGPDVLIRDAIFAATEAWCNVPMGDEESGGPLALRSVFFEFIPEAAYEAGSREALRVEDLEDGARYYIVVTNSAGMIRYSLGDVVEVCGKYQNTPRIRFVRKGGASSNLTGELIHEGHVNEAVSGALTELGLEATWFAMVGDPQRSTPGYDLKVELAPHLTDRSDDALAALATKVDERLSAIAFSYGDNLREGTLSSLIAQRIPQGRYDAWKKRRVSEGSGEAQLKPVHLLQDAAKLPVEFQ